MCWTVASLLYFNGQTTRIEYIGGSIEPPGESIRIAAGGIGVVDDVLLCELSLSVREGCVSDGMLSFKGELGAMSGTKDEAEERADRMLVLEVRTEGSELDDDNDKAGDSRGASGVS